MEQKRLGILAVLAITSAILAGVAYTVFTSETDSQGNNEEIGLVINTPDHSTSLLQLDKTYSDAASTGIGRSNVYLFWDMVEPVKGEYNWEQSDILMGFNEKNNLKVTLYFSVINGSTLGPFPDWMGKPSLNAISEDRLSAVLDAILSRYGIVDTVIMAGETESQFRYSENSIPVYRELFGNVYDRIKQGHPDVRMGNAFSLHNVLNKNLDGIVTELALGDFVGFTYFPVNILNDIDKTPPDARDDLQYALELVPDMTVGFMEIGWSTSDFIGGNEADQSEFIGELLEFYSENDSGIEFVTWYRQYDRSDGACATQQAAIRQNGQADASDAGTDKIQLGTSEHVMERLNHYVCKSGMIYSDGTQKPGWNELRAQLEAID